MQEKVGQLEAKLRQTENGEQPTVKSTTSSSASTCGDGGSVTEEMIEAGVDASENIFESVSNEAAAIIYRAMEAEKGKG